MMFLLVLILLKCFWELIGLLSNYHNKCQVPHSHQCISMFCTEHPDTSLHDLNLQFLCFFPTSLNMVCWCEVVHALECIWMFCTEQLQTGLLDLNLKFFHCLPSSLIVVCQCQVPHALQHSRMFCAKHPDTSLHDLNLQFLCFFPTSLNTVCQCKIVHALQHIHLLRWTASDKPSDLVHAGLITHAAAKLSKEPIHLSTIGQPSFLCSKWLINMTDNYQGEEGYYCVPGVWTYQELENLGSTLSWGPMLMNFVARVVTWHGIFIGMQGIKNRTLKDHALCTIWQLVGHGGPFMHPSDPLFAQILCDLQFKGLYLKLVPNCTMLVVGGTLLCQPSSFTLIHECNWNTTEMITNLNSNPNNWFDHQKLNTVPNPNLNLKYQLPLRPQTTTCMIKYIIFPA